MKSRRKANRYVSPSDEESSIVSDTSSLGAKMQIPYALRMKSFSPSNHQRPITSSSSAAAVLRGQHRSNSRNREEAKIYKLVLDAKKAQERTTLRDSYDSHMAQSISVTLPAAYYREQLKNQGGNESLTRKNSSVSFRNPQSPSTPMFRGRTRNSSVAAGSFSKQLANGGESSASVGTGSTHDCSSPKHSQRRRTSTWGSNQPMDDHTVQTCPGPTRKSWRLRFPKMFPSSKNQSKLADI